MAKTENKPLPRLMSPNEVAAATTMSKTLVRILTLEGRFPKPVQIGEKRIAYVRAEVEAWIDERISGRAAA
ncbi:MULTISPECIES: AlpA family phage regulatory protein [unclassified Sinorhizobium]|uniref:helix-turn-helix transcriptional regulator n=1 Tax=unclassified Sinorhizobium TaxID=2613772 RepID=UPI0024C3FD66|nr:MULTISPECIES: AlpA family phage regulatory protein [unclassified Sinorhizobium]MDK1372948.1 AlpA family phage regulatory protein [Sinorhizobium sp. 6-70]MDK1477496.1 AlpA family phage regulatory protein [Sinorhizobium sp. 6-117]